MPYVFRAANPVKWKWGRLCGSKTGRNSKHFHNNRWHTKTSRLFWPECTI